MPQSTTAYQMGIAANNTAGAIAPTAVAIPAPAAVHRSWQNRTWNSTKTMPSQAVTGHGQR